MELRVAVVGSEAAWRLDVAVQRGAGGGGVEPRRLSGLCGRCLEPVEEEVSADNICLFLEIGDEEEMDISEDIRSEMLLALPMTLLCSDDCRGLCPVCGANRNRTVCGCEPPAAGPSCWDALDDLKL